MDEENKNKKVDISSTAVEKGIDVAKGFIDKLVSPPIEELGLLIKDQISYWRFNNQIKILNKAKVLCEENNIDVKAIPPKLLCPYLENASLEDDEDLQDKWAILLVNMVDSEQNIQNHVFPYILSQLSKDEFNLLESALVEKRARVAELEKELSNLTNNRASIEEGMNDKLSELKSDLEALSTDGKYTYSSVAMELRSAIRSLEMEIRSLEYKSFMLKRRISAPETIPEQNIQEFEMANIIRLGQAE